MMKLDPAMVEDIVTRALEEDVGPGDMTTEALVPEGEELTAEIVAGEECVVAGLPLARAVFERLDGRVEFDILINEGERAPAGAAIAAVRGPARAVLTGERTALNFLQHLSGIATAAAEFVALVEGTGATILDTRKTIPGFRLPEKYAVSVGGGMNHRAGLHDRILIKDNHLRVQERFGADAIGRAVRLAREKHPGEPVEVEVTSLEQVENALDAGADTILLDNMSLDEMREAVALIQGRATTEASGGVTRDSVREIALTGVQYISVGALTHSARSVDISLDVVE